MDTVVNKVDTKGRVSLPSDYRAIVKELSTEIVCYRSLTSPCIEGCPEELLEKLASDMENSLDFFSQEQDDLTNLIFGDAKRFTFDSTGRIVLSGWPHGFGSDGGWVKDYAAWLETIFA